MSEVTQIQGLNEADIVVAEVPVKKKIRFFSSTACNSSLVDDKCLPVLSSQREVLPTNKVLHLGIWKIMSPLTRILIYRALRSDAIISQSPA